MSIEKKIEGSEKAGNEIRLVLDHTLILWKQRNIVHTYSVGLYDADGDLINTLSQQKVTLLDSEFDKWITEEMVNASIDTIQYGYNESLNYKEG